MIKPRSVITVNFYITLLFINRKENHCPGHIKLGHQDFITLQLTEPVSRDYYFELFSRQWLVA